MQNEISLEEFLEQMRRQGLRTTVSRLKDGRIKVVFCGMFKHGDRNKSMRNRCSVKYFCPKYFAAVKTNSHQKLDKLSTRK